MPRRASPLSATAIVASLRGLVTQLHKQRAVLSGTVSRAQRELAEVDQAIKLFGLGGTKVVKKATALKKRKRGKKGKPTQPLVLDALRRGAATLDRIVEATKLTRQQVHNALFQLTRGKKVKRVGDRYAAA